MRILFAGLGSSGHVLPLLAIAGPLRSAGHELAYAVPPNGLPTVERAGVRPVPLNPQERAPEAAQWLGLEYAAMTDHERSLFQVRVASTASTWRIGIETIRILARDWQPDLVVWSDGAEDWFMQAVPISAAQARALLSG